MKPFPFLFALILSINTVFGQYMPEGYENIRLGMTREEVKAARPDVKGLSLGLDPYVEHPNGCLLYTSDAADE